MQRLRLAAVLASFMVSASPAAALTVPFTEDFTSNASGWLNNGFAPLAWVASGGPDGGSYASGSYNYFGFVSPFPGGGPVTFRGHDSFNASGDAFVGDWIAGGAEQLSVWVRQSTTVNLGYFLRVSNSPNFPGAVIASTTVVAPNTWTQLVFDLDPSNPLCIGETITCAQALATVGNVQFGTSAPAALTALNQAFTLDLDKVSLVPEPGALLLLGTGLVGLARSARRRTA